MGWIGTVLTEIVIAVLFVLWLKVARWASKDQEDDEE